MSKSSPVRKGTRPGKPPKFGPPSPPGFEGKTKAQERDEIPMWLCLIAAINEPEPVKEFDRLKGTNLSRRGSPLDLLIDESTGRLEHDFNEFVEFVRGDIYERINAKCE